MTIPRYTNLTNTVLFDDAALKMVIDDMYSNQEIRTWTTIELHNMYCSFGSMLTSQQMFTKYVTHLGNDIVVVRMDGCARRL